MEAVLQKCNGLWTEEYHKEAINILKKGYNGALHVEQISLLIKWLLSITKKL